MRLPNRTSSEVARSSQIKWAFVAMCIVLAVTFGQSQAQAPADDVAAQVRAQGYQCQQPVTATRDIQLSKPDSVVWNLKCKNASYRVRLDPDMAARISPLGTNPK